MSHSDVDKAAANLLGLAAKVDESRHGKPAALIVITTTGAAGRRSDGVHMTPISALRP